MSKKFGGKRYTCGSTKSLGFVKKKKKVSLDQMSRQKLINSDTVVINRGKNTDQVPVLSPLKQRAGECFKSCYGRGGGHRPSVFTYQLYAKEE